MKFDDYFFDRVQMHYENGEIDIALSMLDAVPEVHSQYRKALFYKNNILKDKNSSLSDEIVDNKDAFEIAMEIYNNKDYESAITLFDICIKNNYNLIDSILFKSESLYHLGMFEDANKCINGALKIDENNIKLLQSKSKYLGEMRDYVESLKWIDKAIELDSEDYKNYYIKAISYTNLNNYEKAFECIDKNSRDLEVLLLKIRIYVKLEDYENAEKHFKIAENIYKNNTEVLFSKSLYYFHRSEFENALGCINKCLEIKPQNIMFIKTKLGILEEIRNKELNDN